MGGIWREEFSADVRGELWRGSGWLRKSEKWKTKSETKK